LEITLILRGPLKKYADDRSIIAIPTGDRRIQLSAIVDQLGIPASSISFIQINGRKSDLEAFVEGGEEVVVNPRVAGG